MAQRQDTLMSTPNKRKVLGPCSHILAAAHTGTWRLERPEADAEKCVKCGVCALYCPTACITVNKERDSIEFDWTYCKGCGICANECPRKALTMVPEGSED